MRSVPPLPQSLTSRRRGVLRALSRRRTAAPRNRHPEIFHYFLNIRPDQPLVAWRTQQVRRMKRRHESDAAKILPVAAQLADGNLHLEYRLHGESPQPNDRAGPHEVN